jgi:hypothetical protein
MAPVSEPLADVLGRLQDELVELACVALGLQSALGPALNAVAEQDPAILHKAQALDLMAQRLDSLSIFVAGLARNTPPSTLVDPAAAADGVFLSDLAHRLIGQGLRPAAQSLPSGDMELFD